MVVRRVYESKSLILSAFQLSSPIKEGHLEQEKSSTLACLTGEKVVTGKRLALHADILLGERGVLGCSCPFPFLQCFLITIRKK